MTHTVGIFGANGRVGGATAKALSQSAKDGKIKLVVLYREGKAPSGLESYSNVELRAIDLDGSANETEKAVKGINVLISAVGFGALPSEPNLVDALAKSPDLVTYIPSCFSTTWTEEDKNDEALGPVIKFLHAGWDRATEKKIGVTAIYTGVFEDYFFEYGFVGSNAKQGLVWANQKQMQNKIPITLVDHLAQGLSRLAISDPQSIKNTSHSFVTFWPTGQDLADLYQKINNKPATIKDFTQKDRDEMRADAANFGPAKLGYWNHWENDDWEYEKGGRVYDRGYSGPGIEEVAKRFA